MENKTNKISKDIPGESNGSWHYELIKASEKIEVNVWWRTPLMEI